MNKPYASQIALGAVVMLSQVSAPADTWAEPINIPGSRFIVLSSYNDEAVLDKETGLPRAVTGSSRPN